MARWEANARERLGIAAMQLYGERGFHATAVADIAERAGLTERTFFRYFADKREVLFEGAADLKKFLAEAVASAPVSMAPLDAVATALQATSAMFEQRRDFARERHALIAAEPELQERELIKLASLAASIAEALRHRGVTEPAASLAAEAGIAVFKVSFAGWVHDPKKRDLAHHLRASLSSLRAVAESQESPGTSSSTASPTGASRPRRPRARRTAG